MRLFTLQNNNSVTYLRDNLVTHVYDDVVSFLYANALLASGARATTVTRN